MENRVRRALVSVHDKQGIVEFCRELSSSGVEILSSGGTARLLEQNEVPVRSVSDYTGFPEMLDGRVKTLHPAVHAGILAVRSDPRHMKDLESAGLGTIDLVVVNLYPFEKTAGTEGAALHDVLEMIDIGGPAMVRAAAKNFEHVGVVVHPSDYPDVAREIRENRSLSGETRRRLAVEAFRHTSAYDRAIHDYLRRPAGGQEASPAERVSGELEASADFPDGLRVDLLKVRNLRYGENPHQRAALYRDPELTGPSAVGADTLQGKPLSFNNILDFDAALALVAEFDQDACAIIKHGNPCGVALGSDSLAAYRRALECDPLSAFGGVIALNRPVEGPVAEAIAESFYEGVIAPQFSQEAREALARKKKLRLLATGDLSAFKRAGFDLRRVTGGVLAQGWDRSAEAVRDCKVVTRRVPSEDEWKALQFAWTVAKHVKSNAIVYATAERTLGIGAGQMSRVDAAKFGIQKARVPLNGSAMASDAFFPFRDGVDLAAEAGVTAVVQPGGSIRDREVIAAADEHDMAMVFTGHRHFRH